MNELSERARELIAAVGDGDGPSRGDRERVRRSLFGAIAAAGTTIAATAGAAGVQSGVAAAASAGAAGATKIGGTVALWLVGGGVAGFAVAAPVAMYAASPPPAPMAVSAPAAARVEPSGPPGASEDRAPPARAGEPQVPAANGAQQSPAAIPVESPAPPPAAHVRDHESNDSVSAEVDLLKGAQRALASGDAAGALRLLERHALAFPAGALAVERSAARIFALCELGRVEQARREAGEFLRVAPSSPLVPRVRGSCAGSGGQR